MTSHREVTPTGELGRRNVIKFVGAALSATAAAPLIARGREAAFPNGFLWGAATAGHQIEGNNVNADQWLLEMVEPRLPQSLSGDACNSFELWPTDLDLLRGAGLNTYRFSIEWSRIEPVEGMFSTAMLDHYAAIVEGCRKRGIEPIVTLCHFTTPRWFAAQGGWTSERSVDLFARYCERVMTRLGTGLAYVTTFNEANVARLLQFVFPPQFTAALRVSLKAAAAASGTAKFVVDNTVLPEDIEAVTRNMLAAHRAGRERIKAVSPQTAVGVTLAIVDDQASGKNSLRDSRREQAYGAWLNEARGDDYVGVQNYTRAVWNATGRIPVPPGVPQSYSGDEVYAPSLANAVRYVYSATHVPIIVTEHGVGIPDDSIRVRLIPEALSKLQLAIADGVPVRGYVHWSLLDNYEWGGDPRAQYGLISVDRTTFVRTPKASLSVLGAIARRNNI